MMKTVLILILIAVGLWFYFDEMSDSVVIGNTEIKIEIADTEEKRIKGLSGREYLDENAGLLFIYEQSDFHGIWMKEMKFPIDIIWLGEDKKIVSMVENASPESYPEIFRPDQPARYVLEVNAGFAKSQGLKVGNAFCCFLLKYE